MIQKRMAQVCMQEREIIYPNNCKVHQKSTRILWGLKGTRVLVRSIRKGFLERRYLSGALKND